MDEEEPVKQPRVDQRPDGLEREEPPEIAYQSRGPLPPPPVVNYTRPTLGGVTPGSRPAGTPVSLPSGRPEREDDSSGRSREASWGRGLAVSVSFAAAIVGGFVLGQWIDHRFGHGGTMWGTLSMTLAGLGVGFYNVTRLLGLGGTRK